MPGVALALFRRNSLGFIDTPVWLEIARLMSKEQTTVRKKIEEF
jgi:hypothetical protein